MSWHSRLNSMTFAQQTSLHFPTQWSSFLECPAEGTRVQHMLSYPVWKGQRLSNQDSLQKLCQFLCG